MHNKCHLTFKRVAEQSEDQLPPAALCTQSRTTSMVASSQGAPPPSPSRAPALHALSWARSGCSQFCKSEQGRCPPRAARPQGEARKPLPEPEGEASTPPLLRGNPWASQDPPEGQAGWGNCSAVCTLRMLTVNAPSLCLDARKWPTCSQGVGRRDISTGEAGKRMRAQHSLREGAEVPTWPDLASGLVSAQPGTGTGGTQGLPPRPSSGAPGGAAQGAASVPGGPTTSPP